MRAEIAGYATQAMLRLLVTSAVFLRGVASARRAAIVTATEAMFRAFVVVVMGCFSVLGRCARVAVRGEAGKYFLWAGLGVRSCGSGGPGGGNDSGREFTCGVDCGWRRRRWQSFGSGRGVRSSQAKVEWVEGVLPP